MPAIPNITLHANGGSWGGASEADILSVLKDTAEVLCSNFITAPESIVVFQGEHLPSPRNAPLAIHDTTNIVLAVSGTLWARFAYQFSHELCHLLMNHDRLKGFKSYQVDEILCETASLFSLVKLHDKWATNPPHPHWAEYSTAFSHYLAETESSWAEAHDGPILGTPIEDGYNRRKNGYMAIRLKPLMVKNPHYWAATQYMPLPNPSATAFLDEWIANCPTHQKEGAQSIAAVLRPYA